MQQIGLQMSKKTNVHSKIVVYEVLKKGDGEKPAISRLIVTNSSQTRQAYETDGFANESYENFLSSEEALLPSSSTISATRIENGNNLLSETSKIFLCFSCSLFGSEQACGAGNQSHLLCWNGDINGNWRKLADKVKSHQNNPHHRDYYIKWKTALESMENQCGIDFLATLELLAKHNKILLLHLEEVSRSQQEECGRNVRGAIIKEAHVAIYYSILVDGTPDISHTEQIAFVLRFAYYDVDKRWVVKKRFLRFENLEKKKDADIAKLILDVLEQNDIDLKNCRSRGYNNGSNMSGVYKGVQAIILQRNSQVFYMPCSAHKLNLAGVHSLESSVEMKNYFGRIQLLYNHFSGSPIRWKILTETTGLSLHQTSQTRWSARVEAVKLLNSLSFLWLSESNSRSSEEKEVEPPNVEEKCKTLAQIYVSDVDEDKLILEVRHLDTLKRANLFGPKEYLTSMKQLNGIYQKGLESLFGSICILLRIFNMISVSIAEGEQSFSKLGLVKTTLRSTMSGDR
ncbi:uncharacterized protein LOC136086986 [Hydra vulgaris]|uniref:Uncharacterized protein LOC136086986 n=1 Tax=Hydra vulgaris TaxID=6087 RepID=A0ABM4CUE0_HYDVU